IVDDNGQLIGKHSVSTLDDEIADVAREVLLLQPLQTIAKSHGRFVDANAPCEIAAKGAVRRNAVAAGARIHAFTATAKRSRFKVASRACAFVGGLHLAQRCERVRITGHAFRLAHALAGPSKSTPFE